MLWRSRGDDAAAQQCGYEFLSTIQLRMVGLRQKCFSNWKRQGVVLLFQIKLLQRENARVPRLSVAASRG
jgi:hypothetical protein